MKVDAQELWRAVKNGSLFTRAKTWNGGECEISVSSGDVTVTASDDFVTVRTALRGPESAKAKKLYLSAKTLKAMELSLRDTSGATNLDLRELSTGPAEPEWWEGLEVVLDDLGRKPVDVGVWELNPERLTLLSRLEPKGQYPLSWQACEVDGRWLWGWKYGPRTYGLVVPLDREGIDLEEAALWPR